jgi:L-threonylcarbamoyladenylate synthase
MKPIFADDAAIKLAAKLLSQGRLVAFPTETVYGLGADANNPKAINRIFHAKGRPNDHPLIVHIASIDNLNDWAVNIPDAAFKLAIQFWPGPLALILNKKPEVPLEVTGGQNTVGLRMPNHPVALQLIRTFGGGIAAPSANRFCRISPTQASHVEEELGATVDLILDGGACEVGVESTIVDLSGDIPKLLRPGHITHQAIESVLQKELILNSKYQDPESSSGVRAPGMMAVHYAPVTSAILCPNGRLTDIIRIFSLQNKTIGLLAYEFNPPEKRGMHLLCMPEQADSYAQILYASLRELDSCGLDIIIIEQPPETPPWRAVNDRLGKATTLIVPNH